MAAHGWGTDRPVEDLLFEEGHRFDFYQAARLLEMLHPDTIPVGAGSEPEKEAVRFKSRVALDFPATDVSKLTPAGAGHSGEPAEMTVNFMGLAGCTGPLPMPYTELILERLWNKDTTLRDFLDIFNHRLISLLYRVRKVHRLGFDIGSPEKSNFAMYLFCLMGLGTKGLRGQMRVRDRCLLLYTALLTQQPRSMIGLERLLSHYFMATIRGVPLCGQWRHLEEDQATCIGASGQNRRLGRDAVLGSRIWDQQGKFQIRIGPLALREFLYFLPTGTGFTPLCELTRFYVGEELEFEIRLLLADEEIPETRLGVSGGPRLGWTSWLKTGKPEVQYAHVRLSPRFSDLDEPQQWH
jgi:type VI secretion system protein ImpH